VSASWLVAIADPFRPTPEELSGSFGPRSLWMTALAARVPSSQPGCSWVFLLGRGEHGPWWSVERADHCSLWRFSRCPILRQVATRDDLARIVGEEHENSRDFAASRRFAQRLRRVGWRSAPEGRGSGPSPARAATAMKRKAPAHGQAVALSPAPLARQRELRRRHGRRSRRGIARKAWQGLACCGCWRVPRWTWEVILARPRWARAGPAVNCRDGAGGLQRALSTRDAATHPTNMLYLRDGFALIR
jgi:hypothetical protein